MFDEVGGKLKGFAVLNAVCTAIVALLGLIEISMLEDDLLLSGWVIVLMVVCLALLVVAMLGSCWAIYAFGEVTERTTGIDRKLADANETLKETKELLRKAFVDPVAETERKEQAEAEAKAAAEAEKVRAQEERARREAEAARAKAEAERAEKQLRYDEYWAAHAEERAALEAKRQEAEAALKTLGKGAFDEKEKLKQLIAFIDTELNKER